MTKSLHECVSLAHYAGNRRWKKCFQEKLLLKRRVCFSKQQVCVRDGDSLVEIAHFNIFLLPYGALVVLAKLCV